VQAALEAGWLPQALAAFTGANTAGVRNPLARRVFGRGRVDGEIRRIRCAGHHQPPGTVHDRQPALQRQGADDAVRAASLARSPQSTQFYAKISAQTLTRAYADAGYFSRNVRAIEVLIDRDAVASGAAASGEPWQHYDLGPGYCGYTFFERCQHRMACARCDFYTPKTRRRPSCWKPGATCRR
jgi:hypothetical protein